MDNFKGRTIIKLCKFVILSVISPSLMLLPEVGIAQSQIGPPVPDLSCSIPAGSNNFVTVAITKLVEFGGTTIDGNDFRPINRGDFYAVVTINGITQSSFNERIEGRNFDHGEIGPRLDEIISQYGPNQLWQFTRALLLKAGVPTSAVNIRIEIWDDDPGSNPDDIADLKFGSGKALNLVFDPNTGQVSGDVNSAQGCSGGIVRDGGFGIESDGVEVCFEVSSLPDSDGDGLFDVWEACGFDLDGMPPIDVDLPTYGADPMHKDLFVELDWMTGLEPSRAAIQALKAAFAVAPINAGILASDLTWGKEDGVGPDPDTCRDGVDNKGDGFTDAKDPDCQTGISAKLNPDGKPGINLWVDTGNLTDASGNLVGDDLGEGNPIDTASAPAPNICSTGIGDAFNSTKTQNFNPVREFIFRYGISARRKIPEPSLGELGGNDFLLCQGEGAIDRVPPGVIMHELGHTLNLHHGGNVPDNCKPNYVSVMNYVSDIGIRQAKKRSIISESSFFGYIIDYSPPRFGIEDKAGLLSCEDGKDNGEMDGIDAEDPDCFKRGLPSFSLKEDMLNESMILDPGTFARLPDRADSVNQFVFNNALNMNIVWPLNGDRDGDGVPDGVDWNGNGRPPLAEDGSGVVIIKGIPVPLIPGTCVDGKDNGGNDGVDADDPDCMHDKMLPPINIDSGSIRTECKNDSKDSTLTGFNDWLHISLPFRQFAHSKDGIFNPIPPDQEPTLEELIEFEQELNTADLFISMISDPDTVEVGTDLMYVLTVINKGPNPAGSVEVADALPVGISYKSDDAGCVKVPSDEEVPADTLTCDVGALLPYEQREIKITVDTTGALEGSITNTATVENIFEFAGPDPEPSDNFTTVMTTIIPEFCGNGTVGSGEDCDDGNTLDGDCCSSTCLFESSGSACGDMGDDCMNQDTCDGAGTCTDNGLKPSGTPCSDGNNCTQTDTCQSGVCTGSNPLICGGLPASICGTPGNDNLTGTSLADVMHSSGGTDTINGLGGNDIICGGTGDDTLNGGGGNDKLNGGKGIDSCDGRLPNNPNTGDTAKNCETVINVP